MLTRHAAVAGTFYPSDPEVLNQQLDRLLDISTTSSTHHEQSIPPKALIVPHAGYIYSGPTAAIAFDLLKPFRETIRRVVLLGLSHRVPFHGIATTSTAQFATPLGEIAIDRTRLQTLIQQGLLIERDDAHRWEHSLEVQLPFLQKVLQQFELIPLATGDCTPIEVAKCLQALWGDHETLILVSSDLSHFNTYGQARTIDQDTCQRILQKEAQLVGDQACGCCGINGLLHSIKNKDYRIELLDYRNSGDTAGDKQHVVGYGAFAIYPTNKS